MNGSKYQRTSSEITVNVKISLTSKSANRFLGQKILIAGKGRKILGTKCYEETTCYLK